MCAGSVLVRVPRGWRPAGKVAAFDWDATLTHGHGMWFNDAVLGRLMDLHATGHAICVFSNQARIGANPWGAHSRAVRARIDRMLAVLPVPVVVFVACNRDEFRKPDRGMWDLFSAEFNRVDDLAGCFFVGDAAGRPGDHSDCDRGFASRIGVRFLTPESCFVRESKSESETTDARGSPWRP